MGTGECPCCPQLCSVPRPRGAPGLGELPTPAPSRAGSARAVGDGVSSVSSFYVCARNGIYPLMNFAVSRPHALPRALSQPQEDPQKAKTPTPEPFDVETRKVRPDAGGDSSSLVCIPAAETPQVRARGGITGFQWEFQSPAREGPRARGALSRLIPSWAFPGGADAVQHGAERGQEPVAREYLDPDSLPALGETCTSCWEWDWEMGPGKWDWEIRLENLTGKWEREICLGYQTGKWYWEV